MSGHPIPDAALDDRLAFIGTAGSGKTYNAGGAVERLLDTGARVVVIDPLDVWFGLRLIADGSAPSRYSIPIFGGAHGDLPLNEHAGKLIGETVATMAESCIVSLAELGTKSAERRFMLAFLETLYRRASGEPVHLIFDEADLWAPQRTREPQLQSLMEQIVRRGRVKGFIPWLITQRPAVLSKDVLSQADGIIAFKLTSYHDRDAIGGWVEGQANKDQWKQIWESMPTLAKGEGVIWLPARGVLTTAKFPAKRTFDSSATPKRGQKRQNRELAPLDLTKLKAKLATVESEAKANDPRALKAEIAALKKQMTDAVTRKVVADPAEIEAAERRGYERGIEEALRFAANDFVISIDSEIAETGTRLEGLKAWRHRIHSGEWALEFGEWKRVPERPAIVRPASRPVSKPAAQVKPSASSNGSLSPALQRVINAIGWWRKIGRDPVERARACVVAGYSPKASTFGVYIGELVGRGLVETATGTVRLTDAGIALADVPEAGTAEELREVARGLLSPQEAKVFDAIYAAWPREISRGEVADVVGLSRTASTLGVYIGAVAAYGLIEKGSPGHVKAADWLFP